MADCWIVVGVALLMFQMFFEPEPGAIRIADLDPALLLGSEGRRGFLGGVPLSGGSPAGNVVDSTRSTFSPSTSRISASESPTSNSAWVTSGSPLTSKPTVVAPS